MKNDGNEEDGGQHCGQSGCLVLATIEDGCWGGLMLQDDSVWALLVSHWLAVVMAEQ